MAGRTHRYPVRITWTGNRGTGTSSFRDYGRDHEIAADGKASIGGSSDPSFRGDPARWNPEELLVASLSACHQLWYLGLCAQAGIVVVAYEDRAEGVMTEEPGGAGQFVSVTLRPRITLAPGSDAALAMSLHHEAHEKCFIARSVNFAVSCEPAINPDA
ncbi:MAG: OsmC family protein [Mesorhizobium sp.]|nr:OsmC family protein [Mesorhizobium sp.]MBN9242283.1 OsmC family protein [Mesorhizobium sp.]